MFWQRSKEKMPNQERQLQKKKRRALVPLQDQRLPKCWPVTKIPKMNREQLLDLITLMLIPLLKILWLCNLSWQPEWALENLNPMKRMKMHLKFHANS